ncbi:uncharacterized protein LOC131259316 [Anopheles coustani]|uniref:uncharacterized protein LOC131259316 n=1 Tax=Anopheles coustani TaxID=139045 RepID=UPI00265835CE|nr:uncharacterized protein LOC131259316 [Anopheles coustani]
MARFTFLTIAGTVLFGALTNAATDCPYCFGVWDCDADQTIPSVPCTAALVNETVARLAKIYVNLTEYTIPTTVYSCVKVGLGRSKGSADIFAVQGCTSGTKSICGEATWDSSGYLSCYSTAGNQSLHDLSGSQSLHDLGHSVLTGVLLSVAVLISAFAMSS